MNVDVEAVQGRIAELEQRAASLAARQEPDVRAEFDDLVARLVKTSRVLLRVIDNAQREMSED